MRSAAQAAYYIITISGSCPVGAGEAFRPAPLQTEVLPHIAFRHPVLTSERDERHENAVPVGVRAEDDRYALPAAAVANEPSVEGPRQSSPRVRGVLYGR